MECLVFSTLKRAVPISEHKIESAVLFVLKREHKNGSLSVHIIADTKMRRLQREHRGKNKTTDVLSFAAQEGKWPSHNQDLGDIFISLPQIQRQAKTWGVTVQSEFMRMLVHGILHILGYDHIQSAEAKIMFAKQEKYVQKLV